MRAPERVEGCMKRAGQEFFICTVTAESSFPGEAPSQRAWQARDMDIMDKKRIVAWSQEAASAKFAAAASQVGFAVLAGVLAIVLGAYSASAYDTTPMIIAAVAAIASAIFIVLATRNVLTGFKVWAARSDVQALSLVDIETDR